MSDNMASRKQVEIVSSFVYIRLTISIMCAFSDKRIQRYLQHVRFFTDFI